MIPIVKKSVKKWRRLNLDVPSAQSNDVRGDRSDLPKTSSSEKSGMTRSKDPDEFPASIQKAVNEYMQAFDQTDSSLWLRSERAEAVMGACDADKARAAKENRRSVLLKDAVQCLGQSRGTFFDDLNAWKVRRISGLKASQLPARSHWTFVTLGRVFARQCKLALIHAEQPGDAATAIKDLEKEFAGAARMHAAKPGAGDLKAFLKKFKPAPKTNDPSISKIEIEDRSPMSGESLAGEILRKYGDQNAKKGLVSALIVKMAQVSGQAMAAGLANPDLHSKFAVAANEGRDVWILFTTKDTEK